MRKGCKLPVHDAGCTLRNVYGTPFGGRNTALQNVGANKPSEGLRDSWGKGHVTAQNAAQHKVCEDTTQHGTVRG